MSPPALSSSRPVIAGVLAVLFFLVVPYIGVLSGTPAHLAASFYFLLVGTATILWAIGTICLFFNLLWLLISPGLLSCVVCGFSLRGCRHSSSVVGFAVGLIAIIDTVQNPAMIHPTCRTPTWLYRRVAPRPAYS